MKKQKNFKLPPAEFTNAMNCLYEEWDFSEWESSKEWRLFNAGCEAVARRLSSESQREGERYGKVARGQWY